MNLSPISNQKPLAEDSQKNTSESREESFQHIENAANQFEDIIKRLGNNFHQYRGCIYFGKSIQKTIKSINLSIDRFSKKISEETGDSKDIEKVNALKARFSEMHCDLKKQLKNLKLPQIPETNEVKDAKIRPYNELVGKGISDTFKKHPIKSTLKIAAMVAAVALSVLAIVFAWPLTPLIITFLSITAFIIFLSFSLDVSDLLFVQFKVNHAAEKISNSEIVLILEAKDDHNGAFQNDYRTEFYKLKEHHTLAYEKVGSIEEINQCFNKMRAQNNKIKAIWLRGHGNPNCICLNKDSYITRENLGELSPSFNQIDPNGYIILSSCSTAGKPLSGDFTLAKTIALFTPGRTVIAPSRDTSVYSFLGKKYPLHIKFCTRLEPSKHCIWKYPSKFLNGIKYIFFNPESKGKVRNYGIDVTKVYRYGTAVT